MGINIKNAETVRLIRELAELTGEGQTAAVTEAVREKIAKLQAETAAEARYRAITEIAKRTAPLMKGLDMDEALYGENGLYDRETGLPK